MWRALTAPTGAKAVDLSALTVAPAVSGITVTGPTALRSTAVLAAVRLLSETTAMLPVHLFRRGPDGARSPETSHALAKVLRSPNVRMTSFEFWRLAMVQAIVWGNHYSEKIRDGHGNIIQLIPFATRAVTRRYCRISPWNSR